MSSLTHTGRFQIRRRILKSAAAAAAVVALIIGTALPANAAPLATGTIGNSSGLALTTDWYDSAGKKNVLVVNAYFGTKTATSVYVTKIRLCYSGPSGVWVRPAINREGAGEVSLGIYRSMASGTCTDWPVNRTWTKGASGEVFRVVNYVTLPSKFETVAGYFR